MPVVTDVARRYAGNATMRAQWEAGQLFEFVWEASASLPTANQSIFTHVIDGNYCDLSERHTGPVSSTTIPPLHSDVSPLSLAREVGQGVDWEDTFQNPAGNPPITPQNVANRSAELAAYFKAQAAVYRGPYLALWGCDFHVSVSPDGSVVETPAMPYCFSSRHIVFLCVHSCE